MTKAQIERRRMRRLKKIVRGTMKFFGLSYECPMEYRKDFKKIIFDIFTNIALVGFVTYIFTLLLIKFG